jgi:ABC-type sugar transport system ATPase subunit
VDAPRLAVEGLTKTFAGTQALTDLTLDVGAGEVHAARRNVNQFVHKK